MNTSRTKRSILLAVLALALIAVAAGVFGYKAAGTRAAPSVSPSVAAQVLNVTCHSSVSVGSSYSKVTDMGDFAVQSPDSLVEITYNGQIYAQTMTGNGVIFELRVDNQQSPLGRARALMHKEHAGGLTGIPASMTAVYDNLDAGTHTVSLWALATNGGSATKVMHDPGCFQTDHIVVKEFLPFGSIAVPLVMSD